MKRGFVLLALFLVISPCLCFNVTWFDCATPLARTLHYTDVTVYPSAVVGQPLHINVMAVAIQTIAFAYTNITVVNDGQVYFNGSTIDLCTMMEKNGLVCPFVAGSLSYTYVLDNLFKVPAGNYTITISHWNRDPFSASTIVEYGCLEVKFPVTDPEQTSCEYTSSFSATLQGEPEYIPQRWLQVGPLGNNDDATTPFSWGTFTSISATPDLIPGDETMSTPDYLTHLQNNLVWAINGTGYLIVDPPNAISAFRGPLYIGYTRGAAINSLAVNQFQKFMSGSFFWNYTATLTADGGQSPERFSEGEFTIDPTYQLPVNWSFPILLGNLNPLTVTSLPNGRWSVEGSRVWCTCGYDACGVCGGNCAAPAGFLAQGLTMYQQGAAAIGIAGGIIGILAILFFLYQIYKMRHTPPPDDLDLIDPQKPDYGTMAINQVIEDGDVINEA